MFPTIRVFNTCCKCGYQWAQQYKNNKPSPICPKCKTHEWQGIVKFPLKISTRVCDRCGHVAIYRSNSVTCPKCGLRPLSNNLIYTCLRCTHIWKGCKDTTPIACPKCGNTRWKEEKQPKGKGVNYFKVCEIRLHNPNATLESIATSIGITKERVRQILNNAQLPTRSTRNKSREIVKAE